MNTLTLYPGDRRSHFLYLLWVGLVLLHSFRSRATSWVTHTPVMSPLSVGAMSSWGVLVVLYAVPGITRSTTLRVTLYAYLRWTCPNQRREPLRITSSIGERCNVRRIFFDISVVAIFLLFTLIAQHSLQYTRAGFFYINIL